jgi:hypothetical protein
MAVIPLHLASEHALRRVFVLCRTWELAGDGRFSLVQKGPGVVWDLLCYWAYSYNSLVQKGSGIVCSVQFGSVVLPYCQF